MSGVENMLSKGKFLVGMVHLLPLPGSAGFRGDMKEVYDRALEDAKALADNGIEALMVENFSDDPYGKQLSIEQTTALAAVTAVVKRETGLPVGIDAAFCDYRAALAGAKAAMADFVRLAVFVDTVECFAGVLEPCCSEAVPYRRSIGGESIKIFADVQVKHTHMLVKGIDITESAQVAQSCGADAVIVTGLTTGSETPIETVKRVKAAVSCPVIIGSGLNASNVKEQLSIADGAIVGSSLKTGGKIDGAKVRELVESLKG